MRVAAAVQAPTVTGMTTGTLTVAHRSALKKLGVRPAVATEMVDAGIDPDTAVAVITSDVERYGDRDGQPAHLALFAVLPDAAVLLAAVQAGVDTDELAGILRDRELTADQVSYMLDHGIDPAIAAGFAVNGGHVPDLVRAVDEHPDIDLGFVLSLLEIGATPTDISWLVATGTTPNLNSLLGAQGAVRAGVARGISTCSEAERHLVLQLVNSGQFSLHGAQTLLAALDGAPWIDTMTTLILDGTPTDEALELARADHRVEASRTVTVSSPGSGPAPTRTRRRP